MPHQPSTTRQSTPDEAKRFLEAEVAKERAKSDGLTKDMQALIAEYVTATDEEAPEKIKKNIRSLMPGAISTITHLLDHGSDGIRASLAKYIIDRGLDPSTLGGIDAEAARLTKMIESLQPDAE